MARFGEKIPKGVYTHSELIKSELEGIKVKYEQEWKNIAMINLRQALTKSHK